MAVDPKKCTTDFTNIGIDKDGQKFYFYFTARDAKGEALTTGGDPFGAKMIHCEGGEVPIEVIDNGDGTYKGVFEHVEAGSYFIVVGLMNTNGRVIQDMIKGSPFTVWVGPKPVEIPKEPADPRHSYIHGTNFKQALLKHKSFFTIIAVDANKNKLNHGGDPFKTKIYAPKGSKLPTIPSAVQDQQDGTYIVSYTPVAMGEHRVEVSLNDSALPGTPFEIDVISGTAADEVDPQLTQVDFSQSKADENGLHTVLIIPRNSNGGAVNFSAHYKVKILSPERLEIKSWVNDNGNGTSSLKFKPEADGIHLVQVEHQGTGHVKGSPFKVDWKVNGALLDAVSVLPSANIPAVQTTTETTTSPAPEKLKTEVTKVAERRERSVSAPARNMEGPKIPVTSSGSPSLPRAQPVPAGPSFLPPKASTTSTKVPPKNPPKNPAPGTSKWVPTKPKEK